MASTTRTTITRDNSQIMETLFSKIEQRKTLLTNCTDLYKTLTNHFTRLHNTIDSKTKTLNSKLETLDSTYKQTLDSMKIREDSIPGLFDLLSATVELRKEEALSEVSIPKIDDEAALSETLKKVCRRMEPDLMTKMVVGKRRQSTSLRGMMSDALSECVDGAAFVVDAVREFVAMKRDKKDGLTDKRLAVTIVVGGMFNPDELKEGRAKTGVLGRVFSRKTLEKAEEVLREWKEVAERLVGESGEGTGMGPSESAMFIEMALGFGLKDKFDDGFYKRLMVEFCERRDMAKLAIPVFGDNVADFIEELVKNGKEVEAVYFAFESGLTERFQPASLLKSFWRKSRKNSADIQNASRNTLAASIIQDEANSMEMNSIKSIIKCVEDLKIEEQYPIESLKKRLMILQQSKAERKKVATVGYIKRQNTSTAQTPPSRPAKAQKVYSPRNTFARKDNVSPAKPRVQYTYPSHATSYYVPSHGGSHIPYSGPAVPSYGGSHIPASTPAAPIYDGSHIPALAPAATSYGGSHIPVSAAAVVDQVSQQRYGVPGENAASAGAGVTSYYGSQVNYASYDYNAAAAAPAYPPSSYPQ